MRSFFIGSRQLKLAGIYVATLAILIGGAGFFLNAVPEVEDASAAESTSVPAPHRNGNTNSNNISLTINVDWGEEYLPGMLDTLAEYNVPVTFFLTGRWCDKNPELAKQIAEAGHEIGNHGYSHSSPNASSIEEIIDEITHTEESIRTATGYTTKLYAPPSGEEEKHVLQAAAQIGYQTILWSVDTIDWQKPDADTIMQRVKKKISGGGIILAHPTASTAEALPQLITDLQAEGYTFVTVSQNIGL